MIRLLTRILLFGILLLVAFLIFCTLERIKFKNQENNGYLLNEDAVNIHKNQKNVNKRNKYIIYMMFLGAFVITLVSFYPIEGEFIRFDTPEKSLDYSVVDNILRKNTIVESEGCYFVFSQKNNNINYYTISKYNDKVGMTNYKAKSKSVGLNSEDGTLIMCHSLYDKNSNTSCYFVIKNNSVADNSLEEKNGESVILINGKKSQCIYYKENKGYEKSVYSLIVTGEFQKDVIVNVDGEDIPILPMVKYMFGK